MDRCFMKAILRVNAFSLSGGSEFIIRSLSFCGKAGQLFFLFSKSQYYLIDMKYRPITSLSRFFSVYLMPHTEVCFRQLAKEKTKAKEMKKDRSLSPHNPHQTHTPGLKSPV